MKQALLDTDIISEFLRANSKVVAKVDRYLVQYGSVNISIISYYEILNGLLYKDARKQLDRFLAFIDLNKVLPITVRSARTSAEIQADLRKKGKEIGHADTLIAGIALTNGLQLITNNSDHFKRIKGLDTDNWTK